jgi:hypothetical protein
MTSLSSALESLLASAQRRARRHPALIQGIRSVRNVLHFGPWRPLALAYVRRTSPLRSGEPSGASVMVEPANTEMVVHALEREGYYLGLRVAPDVLREAESFWRDKPAGVSVDAHDHCPAIARIAADPAVLRVVRSYFGCEPTLVECKLFVTDESKTDILATGFHFDHAGVRSLNVMTYLTPVDDDTGPHVLVPGTHRNKRLRDYFRELTPIGEIERRYPGRILTVTGEAGTVLIENAEVFHRRVQARRRRVAMIAVYSTSRRRLLSIGKDQRPASRPAHGAAPA